MKNYCRRHRQIANKPEYEIIQSTIALNDSVITAELQNVINRLRLIVVALDDSKLRLIIDETDGIRARFQPLDALKDATNLKTSKFVAIIITIF